MHSTILHLHQGEADSWAINIAGEVATPYRAHKGVASDFKKVWSLELQSKEPPIKHQVDWMAVLERAIYAYDMNDPLIDDFDWPIDKAVSNCG